MLPLLEKEYLEFLNNSNIKIISFDIFDTLVFRKVSRAIDVFLKVGEEELVLNKFGTSYNFQTKRVLAEKLAREEFWQEEEITLEKIYNKFTLSEIEKKSILNLELNAEYETIFINPQIKKWISLALERDKKIIFTSDMYLSKKQVEFLVFDKLELQFEKKIYMSSEYNLTKHTGNMFNKIIEDNKCLASNILHIGDNKYSDFTIPTSLGLYSIYYNHKEKYTERIFALEDKYFEKKEFENKRFLRVSSMLNNPFPANTEENFFFNLGSVIFGPLLWNFSHWLLNLQKTNKIDYIHCIMREGRLFEKCLKSIDPHSKVNLLYASRKSTFLANFNIEELESRGLDLYGFRKMTVESYYELFKIKIEDTYVLKYKELIIESKSDFFNDNFELVKRISFEFFNKKEQIEKNILKEQELLKKYLNSINLTEKSLLLDFGGTGTIIKNIADIYFENNICDVALFYMHQLGFEKLFGFNSYGFLTSTNLQFQRKVWDIARSPEIIEILFNGAATTTTGYEENEFNDVVPCLDSKKEWQEKLEHVFSSFEKGIFDFFAQCKKFDIKDKLFDRQSSLDLLSRLINIPIEEESKYLSILIHDEGYGTSVIEKVIEEKHIKIINEVGIEKTFINHMSNNNFKIREIPWIQGCLSFIDPDFIARARGLISENTNKTAIENILKVLDEHKFDRISVYGAGEFFNLILPEILNRNIIIKNVYDTKACLKRYNIRNFTVQYPDRNTSSLENNDVIIVSSAAFAEKITGFLQTFSVASNIHLRIINFYDGLIETNSIRVC